MKKVIALLLVLSQMAFLCACGGGGEESGRIAQNNRTQQNGRRDTRSDSGDGDSGDKGRYRIKRHTIASCRNKDYQNRFRIRDSNRSHKEVCI